ncbi:MAG: aminoacetone oxidase family FAD-binding enzyme [Armatimonadetes bacterium]|nr:aminoacetone oxidase family FAD-binding enzyme [Armatimonadota bacterium]
MDVVVIGGGAAGIIAAWRAASLGAKTILIEKTERLGTKILISGGGKCNITHDGPLEDVLRAFRPEEARFIRPACYRFPNTEIVKMLTERGLNVYTREDGRIFPVDQTAKDVVAILASYLRETQVDVRLKCAVLGLVLEGGKIAGVATEQGMIPTRHLVLATGGSSYPKSGTTGDGWGWARASGHRIAKVRAALAPIDLSGSWVTRHPGVALRSVTLKARLGGRETDRWNGDLLMTHHGVSGPCALGVSRKVAEGMESGLVTLEVDLASGQSFEDLSSFLGAQIAGNPRKQASALLEGYIPESLRPEVSRIAALPEGPAQHLSAKALNRIVETLKGLPLGQVTGVPLAKGEVVAGGVSLAEVDPQTMRSKGCPGLYLAGEILDVAGPVGGYNLQAAFATGFVAGETAARDFETFSNKPS